MPDDQPRNVNLTVIAAGLALAAVAALAAYLRAPDSGPPPDPGPAYVLLTIDRNDPARTYLMGVFDTLEGVKAEMEKGHPGRRYRVVEMPRNQYDPGRVVYRHPGRPPGGEGE